MTSKLTRERLQEIAEDGFLKHGESKELARIALAAMDSEPVAWSNGCNKSVPAALRYLAEKPRPRGGESSFNTAHLYQLAREIELMAEAPLYRHAQQPVVPEEMTKSLASIAKEYQTTPQNALFIVVGWNACRAAMLQELQKSAGVSNKCRSNEKVQDLQVGNSPVIPDGSVAMLRRWLAFGRGMQNAGSQLPHNLIAETESMLAAAPTGIPMIPDGYVMVPKEPTAEMQSAGASAIRIETTALNKLWTGNAVFRAMLAAAPQEVK